MRPAFFDDLNALVVDPWEIRGARGQDHTKGFRCPTDADATWLGKKVRGNMDELQAKEKTALEAVLAAAQRREQGAAQSSDGPAQAGAD
eukprot:10197440-Alexandrium_andersonii.AAC.1